VEVEIIDAGMLSGLGGKTPGAEFLLGFAKAEDPWCEMERREKGTSRAAVPLIGRDADLNAIKGLLTVEAVRVNRNKRPTGVGKTRLAIEATRDFQRYQPFTLMTRRTS